MSDEKPTVVETKVLQLKALLGDKAAQDVLEKAAEKEAQAKKAGVEFKEAKPAAKSPVKTKATKAEPMSLAEMLDKIEEGLEAGTIVNDLEESEIEAPVEEKKEVAFDMVALKALIGEVFDEKLTALTEAAKQETTEKEKKSDGKQAELEAKMKAAQDALVAVKAELDELNGAQPKSNGFRPSQAASTMVKEGSPKATPNGGKQGFDFVSEFIMGANGQQDQP